ncbi:MAG: hypothetical protein L3K09_07135 [Thermoplasmata archaeon]|nr:hypothetical protein [Thermoplasmata archaeon]
MGKWFQRTAESTTTIVERVEPVEIPIITETKRRLARGEYEEALRAAYLKSIEDVQRAYDLKIPPGRTHGEILAMEFPESIGHLPEFLRRLYALYQPVRYGRPPWPREEKLVSSLLQSIYSPRPMWQLYVEPKHGPSPVPPVPDPPVPDGKGPAAPESEASP